MSQPPLISVPRTCPECGSGALTKHGDILTCANCGERRHLDGKAVRVIPVHVRKRRRK